MIGVILAGGLSRRMGGGDKCLLELDGAPLLSRAAARLAPQVSQLLLNANGDLTRFASFGLEAISDDPPDYLGPLSGVLAGMERAAALGADQIVTVAADTPFFPRDLVARLRSAAESAGAPVALAATAEGSHAPRHPTFGLWPVALRQKLRRALLEDGVRKIVAWTDAVGCATAVYQPLELTLLDDEPRKFDPFFNINTPEDLIEAEAALPAIEETGW